MSSDKELMDAASKMWGILDELADNNPEEYQKFIDHQLREGRDMFTPPQPVFCLCCNTTGSRAVKLYINICKWNRVPKPKTDQDPVPVKGGVLRHIVKAARKTHDLLFDVAFNPYVIEECSQQKILEEMLTSLILDFVEDFTQLNIDRQSCLRVSEDHKGPMMDIQYSLDEQWRPFLSKESQLDVGDSLLKRLSEMKIKDPDKGASLPPLKLFPEKHRERQILIEEMGSKGQAPSTSTERKATNPVHSVIVKSADSCNPRRVSIKVELPGVTSVGEVELDVSKDDLQLLVGSLYSLTLSLPVPVNEALTRATFSKRTSKLSVTIPCL